MNKLMSMVMAAVLLPVVSFADAPANTYVVPAGGSTPESPYDTWATAANGIRAAADQVAAHGLVTIVSGDYSGEARPMTPKQAIEMQIVDAVGSTDPGTATVCSPLFGFNVANTDPNCHALTVSKGTLKSSGTLFSDGTADGGSSYSGNAANFRMHFTGAATHLDLSGKSFYCGYSDSGDQLRLSDNAKLTVGTFLIGMTSSGGRNTSVIVDSGASVVCSVNTQIGDQTTGCSLTISNATYQTPALTVGANDTKVRNHRVTVCGSAARTLYVPNGTLTLRNDSTLEMNVAEAPLAGYNPLALVYPASFVCNSNATLQVTGLETLAKRLVEAGQKTFSSYILVQYSGQSIVLEGHARESLMDSVAAVPGFSVSVSGPYITLKWTYPGGARTYVVPEGTPGNVPKDPYLTWTAASTNILLAVQQTAANGLVTITNGTYSADNKLVDSRAVNLEVVDYENPTGAGEATVGYTFFYNAVANLADDPNVNAVTLSKGTFKCRGSNDGIFVDYRRAGGDWGTAVNARFTVAGENTVLDTLTKPLYVGFSMKGIRATVTDRAQLKTGTIYIGQSANGGSSGLTVSNGGIVSDTSQVRVGQESAGCYLMVSNGALTSPNVMLDKEGQTHGAVATIAGSNSVVTCSSAFTAWGDSKLKFDVADAPLTGYATVPLSVKDLNFNEDSALEIVGADALLDRMSEADVGYVRLKLAAASGTLSLSDAKLAAARATLPEKARLSVEGGKLVLRLGGKGLTVIVR